MRNYDPPFERFRAMHNSDKFCFLCFASFTNYKYSDLSYLQYSTATYNTIQSHYLHYLQGDKLSCLETLNVVNYGLGNFRNLNIITVKYCSFAKCCMQTLGRERDGPQSLSLQELALYKSIEYGFVINSKMVEYPFRHCHGLGWQLFYT